MTHWALARAEGSESKRLFIIFHKMLKKRYRKLRVPEIHDIFFFKQGYEQRGASHYSFYSYKDFLYIQCLYSPI